MDLSVFDISNFNVIEDENNYYVFRAIEPDDIEDIKSGLATTTKIRTYRERYNEKNEKDESRYTNSKEISLEEIWDHIRINFYPGTNCISFSTNCNVSIDYGSMGDNRYLMMTIPKNNFENTYFASQYMIGELDKKINSRISKINDESLLMDLENINKSTSTADIIIILKKYTDDKGIFYRFIDRQFFNEKQNLEYNKLLGRLSLLEVTNNINSILSRTKDNSSLIKTIGMACSSGEVIHYNDNIKHDVVEISPILIDLFAVLQQATERGFEKEKIEILKNKVLELSLKQYKLNGNKFGNDENEIIINELYDLVLNSDNYKLNNISISDMYELTKGNIPYERGRRALDFTYGFAKSKQKTLELCEVLRKIINDSSFDSVIDKISRECYVLSSEIMNRVDNLGIKVCESVNIGINDYNHKFTSEEQEKIMYYVDHLSTDEKYKLFTSNGLSLEQTLNNGILNPIREGISKNRYFAETIVDRININNIYKSFYIERIITRNEKELLINSIENTDCEKVYNAFLNANINEDEIPYYFVNLLLNNGIGGVKYKDLGNEQNLDIIIKNNIALLSKKISATRFDRLLGISDEVEVDGLELPLRDYQDQTVKKLERIYANHSFAGVVLPTGAGKSFVAITEMLKYKDKNIQYYAPTENILFQMQTHILNNVLGLRVLDEDEEEYYKVNHIPIPQGTVFSTDADDKIKEVFPYLEMHCYQGVINKDEDYFKSRNADFIILDETHRIAADEKNDIGAKRFQEGIVNLIKNNSRAKVLGLTATPVRDIDKVDALEKYAKLSGEYTADEIKRKDYLAAEMTAADAMQSGYIVTPNVITFGYKLDESSRFQEIKALYETEKDPVTREKYKRIYDSVRKLVQDAKSRDLADIIEESFIQNEKKKNGKYIVFLPRNNTGKSTEEYFNDKIEEVKKYFKNIDPEPETCFLYSSRVDKKENERALRKFKKNSDHLQLIFAVDMLNEGSHFDDIDGIFMLRPLKPGNKILYSQQSGRCIFSIDPETKLELSKVPLIFDLYNNYLEQNINRVMNRHDISSDLEIMRRVDYWIDKHKRFPNIESPESTIETNNAKSLKRIQIKYLKYINNVEDINQLEETERFKVTEILELGKKHGLWLVDIPEPKEEEKEDIKTPELTHELKTFLDLVAEAERIEKYSNEKIPAHVRITTALNVLELFEEYGITINPTTIPINATIKDVISSYPKSIKSTILDNIEVDDDYPIGQGYLFAIKMFGGKNTTFNNYDLVLLRRLGLFSSKKYNKEYLDDKGFVIKGPKKFMDLNIYTGTYFSPDGYNITGLDEQNFDSKNSFLNKYNFDREGYYYEVSDSGEYIPTGSKLNPNGFDMYGNYNELQPDGTYKVIGKLNRYGFNIEGYYCTYDKYDRIINTKQKVDEFGFDIDGIYCAKIIENNFVEMEDGLMFVKNVGKRKNQRTKVKTGLPYDSHYFDREGYYYELGKDGERYKTNRKYNNRFLDRYSKYYKLGENGERIPTTIPYDEDFFDIDGYYYELSGDKRVKSKNKYNSSLFNKDGLKISKRRNTAFDKDGYVYYYDSSKYIYVRYEPKTKIDKNGFDVSLQHHIKDENGNYLDETDGYLDEFGFSFFGIYGTTKLNGPVYDKRGFDVNGLTESGLLYDKNHFDREGYYYRQEISFRQFAMAANGCKKQFRDSDELVEYIIGRLKKPLVKTKYKYNERYLDKDGFYYKLEMKDGVKRRVKTKYKLDSRGFDLEGNFCLINKKTGDIIKHPKHPKYDNYGFDVHGYYYKSNGDKNTCGKVDTTRSFAYRLYDDYNFDKFGRYVHTDVSGYIMCITEDNYNPRGFDRDGYYHELLEDGTRNRKPSDRTYDERKFDIDGYYCILDENNNIIGKREFDDHGFDYNCKHHVTGTKIDTKGFNYQGFYSFYEGNNLIVTSERVTNNGFDIDGYYHEMDENNNRKKEHNGSIYNEYGFNAEKRNIETGLYIDNNGFDIDGYYHETYSSYSTGKKINNRGFDREGYYYEYNYDSRNYTNTNEKYNEKGFGLDGYYWKLQEDGTRIKTDDIYDENGYDMYGFDKKGINKETNTKYDKYSFDKNGKNRITGTNVDILGFNKNRIKLSSANDELCNKKVNGQEKLYCIDLIERYLNSEVNESYYYNEIIREFKLVRTKVEDCRIFFNKLFCLAYSLDENIREKCIDKEQRIQRKIEELNRKIDEFGDIASISSIAKDYKTSINKYKQELKNINKMIK